jgi:hypothetical protein
MSERFWEKVKKAPGCWTWTAAKYANGYGLFAFSQPWRRGYAHRASWELAFGAIPDGLWVLHHCDNPACVRPDHLFLGTHADNMRDMKSKGRWNLNGARTSLAGENHPMRRLTETAVRDIRRRFAAGGITKRALAREYGVHEAHIGSIVRGRTWKAVI